ncbi:MAG: sigma-70 family RNA polymerase sigma factor [Planctomycetota bacterium]
MFSSPLIDVSTPSASPALRRDDETALMVAFQRDRTESSFEALYRAVAPGLLAWIESLHLQRRIGADPLDTLQDTFVNVHRYAGSFRPERPGGFRAWVRTIASNAVLRARRRPRTAGILFSELGDARPEPADEASNPSSCAGGAEEVVRMESAYALLLLQYAAAYQKLGDRDREALRLVEVEGRPYSEVGALLRVGRSNTKMIVFRARKRLRAAMTAAFECGRAASAPRPAARRLSA